MTTKHGNLVRFSRTLQLLCLGTAAALVVSCGDGAGPAAPATAGGARAAATLVRPQADIDAAWAQAQTVATDMYGSNRAAVYNMFHSVALTTDWWVTSQDPLSFMNGVMQSTPDFESRLGIRELRLVDGPVTCGASLQGCTIYPAPLAVAATWDVDQAVAMFAAQGSEKKAKGANVSLSPTMNIIRDPRGGRNFESFSEDPHLSAQLAASAVTGIQSNHIIATAKHYLDNDQETNRSTIVVNVDERTQHEIYLAPFQAAVQAGVGAFMCSYNQIAYPAGGQDYACENSHTLKDLLKGELGFRGFVMSDWGATHSGAKAAGSGLDVEMNNNVYFTNLDGQIPDATAREMARRIVFAHLITGLNANPVTKVTKAQGVETKLVSTAANQQIAQRTAEQSIVLLKNAAVNGVPLLPLSKSNPSIAVFGECAETNQLIQGKGSAEGLTTGKTIITPRQAIASALGISKDSLPYGTESNLDAAASLAAGKAAAVVVLCATSMEGYGEGGDRAGLSFGAAQSFSNPSSDALATRIVATGTPTVVMVVSPAQMTMPWAAGARAILWSSLLGEMQAPAIARVLFGDVNPSGKLPITFGNSLDDFPTRSSVYGSITDLFPGNGTSVYYREGLDVGYRHFDARNITPLFPFGHGLSYTTFGYANLTVTPTVNPATGDAVTVALDLTNTGSVAGAEVVQVYLGFPAAAGEPPKVLKGFRKVSLTPGQTQRVTLTLGPDAYQVWSNGWVPATGTFQVMVGSSSRDIRLTGSFQVSGGQVQRYALSLTKGGTGTGGVTSAPAGIDCGATCTASFDANTAVTLTAAPTGGSSFTSWGGACSGTAPTCTLTMSAAQAVTASFTAGTASTLLSQGKPATASSVESASYPASYAVDASATTRWSSQFSDPQWIRIDLGQRASITRVVLSWESAYARAYQLQVSDDATTWTTIYQTTAGAGGAQTLAVSGAGRYVRMYGTARATAYGYSLFDFQVWGTFLQTNPTLGVSSLGAGAGRVVSSPAGIDCPTTCSASFAPGTLVTLTATPDASSTFAGWGGACSGGGACSVTVSAVASVTATFTSSSPTPCANPVTFTGQSGNLNTTGAVCLRTAATVSGWGCSNFTGRTVSVNGGAATATCGAGPFPLGKSSDGYTYFSVSAGTYAWASIYTW